MCSSTYMAFSQNTSHPVGRSPLWLFARTFLNFCHFEGVRMALGQTWFAHMQEPLIPNLVLTQKSHLAPTYFRNSQNTAELTFLEMSPNSKATHNVGSINYDHQRSYICLVKCKNLWGMMRHASLNLLGAICSALVVLLAFVTVHS